MIAHPTPYQIELLQHALGVTPERRQSHRNFFVVGDGHQDTKHLNALVETGLMTATPNAAWRGGGTLYMVTIIGHGVAMRALPEPVPRKPGSYEDYLDANGCTGDSFGEHLAFTHKFILPKFEQRDARYNEVGGRWGYLYRMGRGCSYEGNRIEGGWFPTMKEAKASYKEALKAHQQRQKGRVSHARNS